LNDLSFVLIDFLPKENLSVSSVQVSFIVHASENEGRVVETVKTMLHIPEETLERISLQGYYGNPIVRYGSHIVGHSTKAFVSNLFSKMVSGDKEILRAELSKYVDEHEALHLRLDKQALFDGKIMLSQEDSVKLKIKPKLRYPDRRFLQAYSEILLES
jgi:RNA binding exosome subunit